MLKKKKKEKKERVSVLELIYRSLFYVFELFWNNSKKMFVNTYPFKNVIKHEGFDNYSLRKKIKFRRLDRG